MLAPVTLTDLRTRARKLWERDGRRWAAGATDSAALDIPLHPPTEQDILRDYTGALAWMETWRAAESDAIDVVWAPRRWGRVGEQLVPVRARIIGVDAIAQVAGTQDQWQRWRSRLDDLVAALGSDDSLQSAIITHARTIGELDTTDFHRLRDVAMWLRRNPASGRFIRELPIRGIDTKWLERHRSVVESLVGGDSLGLRQPPTLIRIRFLDPSIAPAGLVDVTAPLEQLSALGVGTAKVLIVENLQTFLALPERPGVIAVDGHGNIAPRLVEIEWLRNNGGVYWGDLDSHGLRILSHARGAGLDLVSSLMDSETLFAFRDLWVDESQPFRSELAHLTESERAALDALREQGNIRLEQERIEWSYALRHLDAVL